MELDTGAAVSLVSEATWSEQLHGPKLQPCTLKLQSYPDRSLEILSSCSVQIHVNGTAETLPLVVVAGKGLSLFGRNWLQAIKLDWTKLARINGVAGREDQPVQRRLETLLQENQESSKMSWVIVRESKLNSKSRQTLFQNSTGRGLSL